MSDFRSFLWALEQNLSGRKNYFDSLDNVFPDIESFEFIKLIGEYKPLSSSLASVLKLEVPNEESNLEDLVISRLRTRHYFQLGNISFPLNDIIQAIDVSNQGCATTILS